jgi:hypothetical protein
VPVCAYLEWNLDGLVEMIWDYLDLQRVYTKPKGRLPDFGDPVVLRRDRATVEDFANRIHKGESASFPWWLLLLLWFLVSLRVVWSSRRSLCFLLAPVFFLLAFSLVRARSQTNDTNQNQNQKQP